MEERVPPHPSSSPSSPHRHLETYVIQIPKDQIYRVPPPENALIVERYRNPSVSKANTRGSCFCCCCCGWVCCAVLTVVVILLVGLAVAVDLFSILGKARDPILNVGSFHVRNTTGWNEFDFGLKTSNPNKHSDVAYKQGGASSLAFRGKEIASGKFPAFLQERRSSSDVRIVLHGSGGKSPPEIAAAMSSKRKGVQPKLSFTLRVRVTARMNVGFLRQQDVELSVSCDYAVDKLTGGTNILSEKCVVEHG
ncbi:hypothetical protein MLD38_034562 [Melastoma candidum]|uniref:Uncharacterized protein n=1 Tax=Melastoma candidum TaxID=119954 RepID=A0ACB9MAV5_9MYRT|nr:hypothetical protein MLD38_034562 [Melastoma candidum]